ncbi:MAG: hypothetical protein FJ318_07770 [SAR202 cluster bacterium]|nr:hypothetical protein [SAR202 cluster bacterium]
MKTIVAIGLLMFVLGYLSDAVELFPIAGAATHPTPTDDGGIGEAFSKASAEETARKVETMYTSVIDDLIAFQRDPDLAKAEAHRQQVTTYAGALANGLKTLAGTLQGKLDELTGAAGTDAAE